jgi:outer membrane protein OmpA-like peptidoglycan-associated protein
MPIQKRATLLRAALLFLLGSAQSSAFGQQISTTTTIDNYPQHATNVNALDAKARVKLQGFANELVGAAFANQNVEVTTIGHADFDAQGRAFEVAISRERAVSADTALELLFKQTASVMRLAPERIELVRFLTAAAGTLRPIHGNPSGEPQRRENRRVELAFSVVPAATFDSREGWQSCLRALGGDVVPPGPAGRMSCVCNKLMRAAPPDTKDYFYDARAAEEARAAAGDISQFLPGQLSEFYRSFMPSLGQRIAIPASSDIELARGLKMLDDVIVRDIKQLLKKSVEPGAGAFELGLASDIANRLHDPNHTYSCYADISLAE